LLFLVKSTSHDQPILYQAILLGRGMEFLVAGWESTNMTSDEADPQKDQFAPLKETRENQKRPSFRHLLTRPMHKLLQM
jgi:hypothetical protein